MWYLDIIIATVPNLVVRSQSDPVWDWLVLILLLGENLLGAKVLVGGLSMTNVHIERNKCHAIQRQIQKHSNI